jgi:hypothetical protein
MGAAVAWCGRSLSAWTRSSAQGDPAGITLLGGFGPDFPKSLLCAREGGVNLGEQLLLGRPALGEVLVEDEASRA